MVAKIMYAQIFCKNFHIFVVVVVAAAAVAGCEKNVKQQQQQQQKIKVRLLLLSSAARSAFSRQIWLFSKSIAGQNQKHDSI